MTEQRPIPGYGGRYSATDDGHVITHLGRAPRRLTERTLPSGYYAVHVVELDGRHRTRPVHRLVGEAFHGPLPHGMQTRHLDGDSTNNRPENLAYGTPSENTQDTVAHGTHPWARKTHCPAGHAYAAGNVIHRPDGRRECVTCKRASSTRYKARQRQILAGTTQPHPTEGN